MVLKIEELFIQRLFWNFGINQSSVICCKNTVQSHGIIYSKALSGAVYNLYENGYSIVLLFLCHMSY